MTHKNGKFKNTLSAVVFFPVLRCVTVNKVQHITLYRHAAAANRQFLIYSTFVVDYKFDNPMSDNSSITTAICRRW